MKCKLCNKEKNLIKKSHIIPDFLFSDIYDEKHRLIKFDVVKMLDGDKTVSKPPTSIYEKYILCEKCDNEVLNNYETYYSKIYHNSNYEKHYFLDSEKLNYIVYQNLDYNKTNIFFLTLLWRAHICTKPEFKDVTLDSNTSENIRNQIISGLYDENSIKITALKLSDTSDFNRSIGQFKKMINSFSIIIKDFVIFFHIKPDDLYNIIHKHHIEKNGSWRIAEIPKTEETNFMYSYIKH